MKKLLRKLIPDWLLSIYHWKLALIGALVYGWPSRKLKVIGVTGTKGKSTVVVLAGKVLEETNNNSLQPPLKLREEEIPLNPPLQKGEGEEENFTKGGSKVGWISSLTINDGKREVINPFHMTMPGRFFIQKTLAQMVENGCEYALVEVTSEGIKQHRHRFIKWAGAVFTNLAPEHLEAHGGFENYRRMKEKLFAAAAKNKESFGAYNLDDGNVNNFLAYDIKSKIGYTLKDNFQFSIFNFQSIFNIKNIRLNINGSEFEINNVKFKTNLLGEFNVYNCAAAVAIGQACGVPLTMAARVLNKIPSIPGRLEIIDEGQDFTVVVDFAHTPDSFEQVFKLFYNLKQGKIVSVFGSAGGGRDKWKRPEMGRIASFYSDIIIITNDDPYDENPSRILSEIKSGISKSQFPTPNLYEIQDRRQAISRALSLAQKDDIVLILGKGTEQVIILGDKKYNWDDREVVREEIRKIEINKAVH